MSVSSPDREPRGQAILSRAARIEDLETILLINRKASLACWSPSGYTVYMGRQEADFRLVQLEGTAPLGFYLSLWSGREMEILKLAVAPAFQGRGLGRTLLEICLERGKRRGCQQCFLEARLDNLAALRFYFLNGFQPLYLRRNYYRDPAGDALILKRALQPRLIQPLLSERESGLNFER